jgi:Zn-finger protein
MAPTAPAGDSWRPLGLVLVAALAFSGALAYGSLRVRTPHRPETAHAERPIQVADGGFVSSDTCRACHPGQYASWHRSYHRTMTGVATPTSVLASFGRVRVDQVNGRPMFLERRGDELWAEIDEPDWDGQGDAPPRIRRKVVMTTGSHHQQIYWYATGHGRLLGQLPAIQLAAERRWVPRRSAVMHPPDVPLVSESGSWNGICVQCHTTNGRPEFSTPFGTENLFVQTIDTRAVEFGIACESCHGPANAHVQANRSPLRRYSLHLTRTPDPTIVEPRRLDVHRSSEVCGQCHGLWEYYDEAAERQANSEGLPYRPGDQLTKTRFIVQPTSNLESPTLKRLLKEDPNFVSDIFWKDGMVRATGREYNGLIDSPCYKNAVEGARTLSCMSCHAMHKPSGDPRALDSWADDQLKSEALGNDACLQCHGSLRDTVTAHTRHRAESAGSSCYNCHMPHTTYGLLKTIRSHQINSPSVQATLDTGRPNACNLCHLDKTLEWTSRYLDQWYRIPAPPALGSDERSVAASILVLFRGDAGQRAIIAQALGWAPAQHTAGTDWMAPFLSLLLTDPYDAVRYIAGRSLQTLPGYESFPYDFVASPEQRIAMRRRALDVWRNGGSAQGRRGEAALLFNPDGTFIAEQVTRLSAQRNNRRVFYRE